MKKDLAPRHLYDSWLRLFAVGMGVPLPIVYTTGLNTRPGFVLGAVVIIYICGLGVYFVMTRCWYLITDKTNGNLVKGNIMKSPRLVSSDEFVIKPVFSSRLFKANMEGKDHYFFSDPGTVDEYLKTESRHD